MRATVKRVSLITSHAPSLILFRGPLIRELVTRGIDVYALAPDYSDDSESQVRALGAEPIRYSLQRGGTNPWRDTLSLIEIFTVLRRLKPNVVLSYFAKPVIYGTVAAKFANVERRLAMIEGLGTVFSTPREIDSPRHRYLRALVLCMYRRALRYADKVLFLNRDDVNDFLRLDIVRPEQVVNLGGIGVVLDEWPQMPPAMQPITFTMAARLLQEKGVREFAEAARLIKSKYPTTRFLLLGGVDTENPGAISEDELRTWQLEGVLEWKGHVHDVRHWYAQTSVYVLPSWYREGVPRSIQEAMATGRPVITTDMPGCRETVVEGVNGFLVKPRDPVSLAAAMERFILDPSLISRMGAESRRLAEERFDANRVIQVKLGEMGIR